MRTRPFPIVLSAPSGSGKTTICRQILKNHPEIMYSVSATTRPRRPEEVEGQDYFFVSAEKFEQMVKDHQLVEWATVHGYSYGTPCFYLDRCLGQGSSILLDIDIQGGLRVKELYPQSVLIFILPPSLEELTHRLRRRGTETPEVREIRLGNALGEIRALNRYDYLVINDSVERAVTEVEAILKAESLKVERLEGIEAEWPVAPPE